MNPGPYPLLVLLWDLKEGEPNKHMRVTTLSGCQSSMVMMGKKGRVPDKQSHGSCLANMHAAILHVAVQMVSKQHVGMGRGAAGGS